MTSPPFMCFHIFFVSDFDRRPRILIAIIAEGKRDFESESCVDFSRLSRVCSLMHFYAMGTRFPIVVKCLQRGLYTYKGWVLQREGFFVARRKPKSK